MDMPPSFLRRAPDRAEGATNEGEESARSLGSEEDRRDRYYVVMSICTPGGSARE